MTTTTQNTVFTVTPVAVKAEPARCEEGAEMYRAWAQAVLKASLENWQTVMGRGYLPFLNHAINCPACLEYEQSRGRMK